MHISRSLEDTKKLAEVFAKDLLSRGKREFATTVGLYGDLGSGKTTFVQSIARYFGIRDSIQSPTFVIMKSYELQVTSYKSLIHIDAYRLNSADEIRKLGFGEMAEDPGNLILIEWPERVAEAMPDDHIRLDFRFVDDTTREIDMAF